MLKEKHIQVRIEQCLTLSKLSNCERRKFGAMIIDPLRNVVLMDGYNGGPRGAGQLCGGSFCERSVKCIPSGSNIEIGCHHAEMNVICNAAASGIPTANSWMIITGEPCLMCAKLIHHAGIAKVIVINGGYAGPNGVDYLKNNNIEVELANGPTDPRLKEEST